MDSKRKNRIISLIFSAFILFLIAFVLNAHPILVRMVYGAGPPPAPGGLKVLPKLKVFEKTKVTITRKGHAILTVQYNGSLVGYKRGNVGVAKKARKGYVIWINREMDSYMTLREINPDYVEFDVNPGKYGSSLRY